MVRVLLATALIWSQTAQAQIALPSVRLPTLPTLGLPATVDRAIQDTGNGLDPRRLQDLRKLHIVELLRVHRDAVEADPNGAPIVRHELLIFSPSDTVLDAVRAAGFSVARTLTLEGLDARIVVLRAPEGMSTRRALARLKVIDPTGAHDFNHLYTDSGLTSPGVNATSQPAGAGQVGRLGLIDGGVDTAHSVFHELTIHQHGCADGPVPSAHGTAVASLMTGRSARFHGAAAGSELYAADVFCGLPAGGAVDAVADAFGWLVKQRVPVINVSLVGPPNAMLENVVRMVIARGYIVVAAVGNDGPAAAPLYPASYPDVIGVTAVDARRRVLVEAGRGRQVTFAAPGADMAAASTSESYMAVRGTSFAAPIVAGLLSTAMREPDRAAAGRAVAELARQALDLGSPGPDPVYGNGLVGDSVRPEASLAGSHAAWPAMQNK